MIIVPLQVVVVLGFKIECFGIDLSVYHLICGQVIFIFDIKCLLIVYYQLFELDWSNSYLNL